MQGLYAITDEILTPRATILKQAETALRAGVKMLQYRNKTDPDDAVETLCSELQSLCWSHGALFVIDDRPFLAQKIGADGLHIGKNDMELSLARRIFPEGLIGVSCYGSVRKALEAQDEGADYVAFGSFFPSPTKPASGIVSMSVLEKAKTALVIPVCAIGGINVTNIHEIAARRPDMISVVSAIWSGDIARNVRQLTQGMNV
ncbi:MAG: thiamine phosphate synthase [Campylobacterales bacterium]|nr:thiamine phosphate synthase [Campylobacterales bacterium]